MAQSPEKGRLNEVFATVAKGLAHANRLQLLEMLAQGERDVDSLARGCGLSVANASHHLRLLRQCGLIHSRQEGQRVLYRLSTDSVVQLIFQLQRVAVLHLPELDRILAERFPSDVRVEETTPQELDESLRQGRVAMVLDLRPAEEFAAGHIPGARHAAPEDIAALPDGVDGELCVVYCRGSFCLFPALAARELLRKGYAVKRLEGGFPSWRVAGKPVAR
jgi:DNA-binding transcriptional ArsR family regulator/rhodanese-related sulfurtransferase